MTARFVYSATPSGHNLFDHVNAERRQDGALYQRASSLHASCCCGGVDAAETDPAVRADGRSACGGCGHARRHEPDRLHAWVFRQGEIWVDVHGLEHDIDSMPVDYVSNVIGFCQAQAVRIAAVVLVTGCRGADEELLRVFQPPTADDSPMSSLEDRAQAWLEMTPLLAALRRRETSGA